MHQQQALFARLPDPADPGCFFRTPDKDTLVNPPPKSISLADIHSIYRGKADKPGAQDAEAPTPTYKTTNRFAREATHPGNAPERPLAPGSRRSR